MSFKKKLVIAFSIVIILPVILFLVAFFVVGNILFHQTGDGTIQSYSAFWTDQQTATQEMDSLYNEISDRLASDPTALEDTSYLDSLKQELNDRTFLIVRKGNAVYYTTNQRQTDKIFDKLPGPDPAGFPDRDADRPNPCHGDHGDPAHQLDPTQRIASRG